MTPSDTPAAQSASDHAAAIAEFARCIEGIACLTGADDLRAKARDYY